MASKIPTRKTTRYLIPHPVDIKCRIAGDLEQVEFEQGTRGRKVALILHGTMGHKDYLYQKRLARALPLDSFRFDFRGHHETGGVWKMANFFEDVEDIQAVVQFLSSELGYTVDLLVGHSKGSVSAMLWLCKYEEAKSVRGFVNVSGRYRTEKIYDLWSDWVLLFPSQGYAEWKVTVARKPVVGIVYPEDMAAFAALDTSIILDKMPQHIHILTLHGLQDKTVPPYDAFIYARAFGARSPGTHNLHIMEEADHNFTGLGDEVVTSILDWWSQATGASLRTGVWGVAQKAKL